MSNPLLNLFSEDPKKTIDYFSKKGMTPRDIYKAAGKELLGRSRNKILPSPMEQVLSIMSLADFAKEDQEVVNVSGMILNSMHQGSTPYVIDMILDRDYHQAPTKMKQRILYDFCSCTLMGLAKHYQAFEKRTERSGAPEPEYYRKVSIKFLDIIGFEDISKHFRLWENHIQNVLTELKNIPPAVLMMDPQQDLYDDN